MTLHPFNEQVKRVNEISELTKAPSGVSVDVDYLMNQKTLKLN